jgi:hypothetical protein
MSAGPARIFGLPMPRIEVGESANLVLLDLDAAWTVTEAGFASKSVNSWLLGETLSGNGRQDDRRRKGGVRGMSSGFLASRTARSSRPAPSAPPASRSARPSSRPR